jgi:hypothetical protein
MPFYVMPKGNSPVLAGSGAPSAGLGNVGDLYLDASSSTLYGPKTLAGWGAGVSLQGQQGIQGETGEQGIQGETGQQGIQGVPGLSEVSLADDVQLENLADGDVLRWSNLRWRNMPDTSLVDGGNFVFAVISLLGLMWRTSLA